MHHRRLEIALLAGALVFLPQACADNSAGPEVKATPLIEPLRSPATIGSIMVGVVEETTTTCLRETCSTRTSKKNVSVRVGNGPKDLRQVNSIAAAARVEHRDTSYTARGFEVAVRGHKLTATTSRDGTPWKIDISADSTTGLVTDYEFREGGHLTFSDRVSWDSAGGVWFKTRIETKWRKNEKDLVTRHKTFTPTGIVSPSANIGGQLEYFPGGVAADCSFDAPCLPMPGETWHWFYDPNTSTVVLDAAMEGMLWGAEWLNRIAARGITDPWAAGEVAIEVYGLYVTPSWGAWIGLGAVLYFGSDFIQENVNNWLDEAVGWIVNKISDFLHNFGSGDPNME
jgi:hypothetical protein